MVKKSADQLEDKNFELGRKLQDAKWAEGKAMMGTIAVGIRAWVAQNQISGSWTQDDLTYEMLGVLQSDFNANYFSHTNFSWDVSYNKAETKFSYTIKATAGKGITHPASITLDQNGKWKIYDAPPKNKKD